MATDSSAETPPSRRPLAAQAFAAAFNHLLQQQPGGRERLERHGGKTLSVNLPPLLLLLSIDHGGMVAAAEAGTQPDATLGVSPLALFHVLSSRPVPQDLVHAAGDSTLAVDFGNVMQGLRWDAEEDLSKVFGDVLAHRIAGTGMRLAGLQRRGVEDLLANFTEYWTEERPLLAKPSHVARFIADVDRLRDDAERLEKRLERLAGQLERRD